jgi:Ca2+-transporting ATPase
MSVAASGIEFRESSTRGGRAHCVHGKVTGRRRYRLSQLKRRPKACRALEARLRAESGVHFAEVSAVSGSILIIFAGDFSCEELVKSAEAWASSLIENPRLAEEWIQSLRAREKEETAGPAWHHLSEEAVLGSLSVSRSVGLSSAEASLRIQRYGGNFLASVPRRTSAEILAAQIQTLPVALLMGSSVISLFTGGVVEALAIFSVVAANSYIGYAMEASSERAMSKLAALGPKDIEAIRDGKKKRIATEKLVPGDLILLSAGMFIPADARVLEAEELTIDEAALTGESITIQKHAAALPREETLLADRVNMVYRGTIVTSGSGLGLIVATGRETEIGKIQSLLDHAEVVETPLQKQLHELSQKMVSVSGLLGLGVFTAGLLRGYRFLEMLNLSISVVIAAVPEGLPILATTTLTNSAKRLRKRNVLIRRLDAVETLGGIQVICLDKTGTLTLNHMSAVSARIGGTEFALGVKGSRKPRWLDASQGLHVQRFLEVAVLCNEARVTERRESELAISGSATEAALLEMAIHSGANVEQLRALYPTMDTDYRTESRSYMITRHQRQDGGAFAAIKGSPLEVLALCDSWLVNEERKELTDEIREKIAAGNTEMADRALRVLGLAYGEGGAGEGERFVWLGLAGMADTPRPGTRELIERFHTAGVRTVMITGDQTPTATALAKQLGISGSDPLKVFNSTRMKKMTEAELKTVAKDTHVFARVSPSDKSKIVRALRANGFVVAMAGDGINDAPALRAADVGVALGKHGTEVAREVADVILMDDNLHSLLRAIEQGRTTHDAIKKSVLYLLTTNLSESILMTGAVGAGLGQPLNPLQILWINIVSDTFPALALALEPPETGVLSRKPRDSDESIVGKKDFREMLRQSGAMTVTSLASYGYGLSRYGQGAAAQTISFTTLAISQLLHTISARDPDLSLFSGVRFPKNRYVAWSIGTGLVLQFLALAHPGFRRILGTRRLGLLDLSVCVAAAGANFAFSESRKPKAIAEAPAGGPLAPQSWRLENA